MRRCLWNALLLCGPLLAQGSLETGAASVAGVVIDAKTRRPVSRAKIILHRQDNAEIPYGALTDARGRFSFRGAAPGMWVLGCSHSGFYGHIVDKKQERRPGIPFQLKAGESVDGIVFELLPHGHISGVVTLDDGSPAESVELKFEVPGKPELSRRL